MKKLSKAILSVAAVSAVSAVMAASAMAMSATYADGVVTLADVNKTGDSQTLLVLSEDAETVTEGMIKQIDQKDDKQSFSTVKVGTLTDGTYYVRVGGSDGTMQKATFTVGTQGGGDEKPNPPAGETETIIIGDCNLNGELASNDLTFLGRKLANITTANTGKVGQTRTVSSDNSTVIIGDCNLNGELASNDLTFLGRKLANITTANTGKVGETKTVEKLAD